MGGRRWCGDGGNEGWGGRREVGGRDGSGTAAGTDWWVAEYST